MGAKSGELVRSLGGALASAMLAVTILAGAPVPHAVAAGPISDWQETAVRSFTGIQATTKSQGMASDGTRMFFSWNLGLHSTGLDMDVSLTENLTGIPHDMSVRGSNHIGDIDYYDGKIYAPIEDGPGYLVPTIVPFDAETLQAGPERYLPDHAKLTKGAPWVAIDPERQVAYTAQWDPTTEINVHRLSDFAITSTIPLDRNVPRIQGAKVYKGYLYAARDNYAEKSVIAIDPETGHVRYLFDRNLGLDHEVEGMAFVTNETGTTLQMADIVKSDGSRVDIHSYRIAGDVTPPSLTGAATVKRQIWPGQKLRLKVESSEDVTVEAGWLRCVGARKTPCRRTKDAGAAPLTKLKAGDNSVVVPMRRLNAPKGSVLRPGWFRLSLTPTDIADAIGRTVSLPVKILVPRR